MEIISIMHKFVANLSSLWGQLRDVQLWANAHCTRLLLFVKRPLNKGLGPVFLTQVCFTSFHFLAASISSTQPQTLLATSKLAS